MQFIYCKKQEVRLPLGPELHLCVLTQLWALAVNLCWAWGDQPFGLAQDSKSYILGNASLPNKLEWFVTFIREQRCHNVLMSSLKSYLMNCNPETAEVVKSFSHYLFSPYIFKVKEPCNHANILTKPDPRTFWTNDDSGIYWKNTLLPYDIQKAFCSKILHQDKV